MNPQVDVEAAIRQETLLANGTNMRLFAYETHIFKNLPTRTEITTCMRTEVIIQVRRLIELLAAHRTLKFLLYAVYISVFVQGARQSERPPADVAAQRTFARVRPHVHQQQFVLFVPETQARWQVLNKCFLFV